MSELEERLSWDEYFMSVAKLVAMRSDDPDTKVGAVIVKDNTIVATGYNGKPKGMDIIPWGKSEDPMQSKFTYVVHSELNAILSAGNRSNLIQGATIYVTRHPCNECAKAIIQSGIKEVVFDAIKHEERFDVQASKIMFESAGVSSRRFLPSREIVLPADTEDNYNFGYINPMIKPKSRVLTPDNKNKD